MSSNARLGRTSNKYIETLETTMKKIALALLAAIGLAGCVAYPVYESPRASYYAPEPSYGYYGYSYSRPYRGYYGYNSRSYW